MTPVDRMLASLDDEQNLDAWERYEKRLRDTMEDLPDDMSIDMRVNLTALLYRALTHIAKYKIKLGMI